MNSISKLHRNTIKAGISNIDSRKSGSPRHRRRPNGGGFGHYSYVIKVSFLVIASSLWTIWILRYDPVSIYDHLLVETETTTEFKTKEELTSDIFHKNNNNPHQSHGDAAGVNRKTKNNANTKSDAKSTSSTDNSSTSSPSDTSTTSNNFSTSDKTEEEDTGNDQESDNGTPSEEEEETDEDDQESDNGTPPEEEEATDEDDQESDNGTPPEEEEETDEDDQESDNGTPPEEEEETDEDDQESDNGTPSEEEEAIDEDDQESDNGTPPEEEEETDEDDQESDNVTPSEDEEAIDEDDQESDNGTPPEEEEETDEDDQESDNGTPSEEEEAIDEDDQESDNGTPSPSEEEESIDEDDQGNDNGKDDDDQPVTISHKRSILLPADDRVKNHKYLFVHIGKAGGTTLQNNIRSICLRNTVEHNIRRQKGIRKKKRMGKSSGHPGIEKLPCYRMLTKQADPKRFNPTTEMALSNGRLIGSMHMNFLQYWWNANDDGEAIYDGNVSKVSIQDHITDILASGTENFWNITAYHHPPSSAGKDTGMTQSTAFLTAIRDPIDRLVSAFNYHHPENHITKQNCQTLKEITKKDIALKFKFKWWKLSSFYCECFPTVNDLADVFMGDAAGGASKYVSLLEKPSQKISCLEIAKKILRGNSYYKIPDGNSNNNSKSNNESEHIDARLREDQKFDLDMIGKNHWSRYQIGHITLNYGYYYRRTFLRYPQKDIVAIRTEHLWEDLQNLEFKLGGTAAIQGEATGHMSRTYGSKKFVASVKITDPKRLQAICCAISSEARIYIELLERAINLSDKEKKESLTDFEKRCDLKLC